MRRDLSALGDGDFEVVVVGGGIHGICTAYDAAARGLRVALVERGDFASATSANSFRIIHGGIRYLQHGDVYRVRESSRERTILMRIAPHLAYPLPIVVPTYGHGRSGPEVLGVGLALYNLLVADRNRGITDPDRRIPGGRLLSRAEVLRRFPEVTTAGLTGGALFADGQMYNPPRLALSFLRSAVSAGCTAANYVEATGFIRRGDRVAGVECRDVMTGDAFTIRAGVVINAAGPWAEALTARALGRPLVPPGTYSRDACLVVRRAPTGSDAIAIPAQTRDPDAMLSRGARHLFVAPWRGYTLVGTWHTVHRGAPDAFTVTERELAAFVDEVGRGAPWLRLTLDDITLWNAGLVLFGENVEGAVHLSYGKRSRIVDHADTDRLEGLITSIGVRWTTARGVAERVIGRAFRKLGRIAPRSPAADRPIHGGDTGPFEAFTARLARAELAGMPPAVVRRLAHNYGSSVRAVLAYGGPDPSARLDGSDVLRAEVVHAVRDEMALTLGDVVFRRTDLGTADHPGAGALADAARIMAAELGWSPEEETRQREQVEATFTRLAPHHSATAPRAAGA